MTKREKAELEALRAKGESRTDKENDRYHDLLSMFLEENLLAYPHEN